MSILNTKIDSMNTAQVASSSRSFYNNGAVKPNTDQTTLGETVWNAALVAIEEAKKLAKKSDKFYWSKNGLIVTTSDTGNHITAESCNLTIIGTKFEVWDDHSLQALRVISARASNAAW